MKVGLQQPLNNRIQGIIYTVYKWIVWGFLGVAIVQQDEQRNMLLNYQLWRKCVWGEYMI